MDSAACKITDGTAPNPGDCGCKGQTCNEASGRYCHIGGTSRYAKCETYPACPKEKQDGVTRLAQPCVCGYDVCGGTNAPKAAATGPARALRKPSNSVGMQCEVWQRRSNLSTLLFHFSCRDALAFHVSMFREKKIFFFWATVVYLNDSPECKLGACCCSFCAVPRSASNRLVIC